MGAGVITSVLFSATSTGLPRRVKFESTRLALMEQSLRKTFRPGVGGMSHFFTLKDLSTTSAWLRAMRERLLRCTPSTGQKVGWNKVHFSCIWIGVVPRTEYRFGLKDRFLHSGPFGLTEREKYPASMWGALRPPGRPGPAWHTPAPGGSDPGCRSRNSDPPHGGSRPPSRIPSGRCPRI